MQTSANVHVTNHNFYGMFLSKLTHGENLEIGIIIFRYKFCFIRSWPWNSVFCSTLSWERRHKSYGSGAMNLKSFGNVRYRYNCFQKSEKNLPRIYAALKNFGPAFEELNKRSVLSVTLVKYCYKITCKKTWKYSKRVQICPYMYTLLIRVLLRHIHTHRQ